MLAQRSIAHIRRFSVSSSRAGAGPFRILFMGTDDVAAPSLQTVAELSGTQIDVLCPAPRERFGGKKVEKTAIQRLSEQMGLAVVPIPNGKRRLGKWLQEEECGLRDNDGHLARYDLGVVVSFGFFIPRSLLALLRLGAINMHPSLLPRHRGASPIASTLLSGDAEAGVSVCMIHPKEFDKGSLLSQRTVPLSRFDTQASLRPRVAAAGATLLSSCVRHAMDRGELPPAMDQDESKVTWTRKTLASDGVIQPLAGSTKAGASASTPASEGGDTAATPLTVGAFLRNWRGHDGMCKTVAFVPAPGKGKPPIRITVHRIRYPAGWGDPGSLAAPREGSLEAPREGSLEAPREGSLAAPREGSLAAPGGDLSESTTSPPPHDKWAQLLADHPPPGQEASECSEPEASVAATSLLSEHAHWPALLLHSGSKTAWLGLQDGCVELRDVKASKGRLPKGKGAASQGGDPTAFALLKSAGLPVNRPIEVIRAPING